MALASTRRARLGAAAATAGLLVTLVSGTVLAGEVTGNGRLLTMHGRSECSFSGQEDLQFFTDDSDAVAKDMPTRGDPAHAQSWGQIPKAVRDELAGFGLHPGTACNPTRAGGGEPWPLPPPGSRAAPRCGPGPRGRDRRPRCVGRGRRPMSPGPLPAGHPGRGATSRTRPRGSRGSRSP